MSEEDKFFVDDLRVGSKKQEQPFPFCLVDMRHYEDEEFDYYDTKDVIRSLSRLFKIGGNLDRDVNGQFPKEDLQAPEFAVVLDRLEWRILAIIRERYDYVANLGFDRVDAHGNGIICRRSILALIDKMQKENEAPFLKLRKYSDIDQPKAVGQIFQSKEPPEDFPEFLPIYPEEAMKRAMDLLDPHKPRTMRA